MYGVGVFLRAHRNAHAILQPASGEPFYGLNSRYHQRKMKTLLFGLLLATAAEAQSAGRLFLHMASGFDVVVGSTSHGVATADFAGKIVDLPPGAHHVVVRSNDVREGAFNVVTDDGQTKDVALSPLR